MILQNNLVTSEAGFSEKIFEKGLSIYEVIRIFKGNPIFLKDNLLRLDNSLKKSNIDIHVEDLNLPDKLQHFIRLENMTEGNLKYVLHLHRANRMNIFSKFRMLIPLPKIINKEFRP